MRVHNHRFHYDDDILSLQYFESIEVVFSLIIHTFVCYCRRRHRIASICQYLESSAKSPNSCTNWVFVFVSMMNCIHHISRINLIRFFPLQTDVSFLTKIKWLSFNSVIANTKIYLYFSHFDTVSYLDATLRHYLWYRLRIVFQLNLSE